MVTFSTSILWQNCINCNDEMMMFVFFNKIKHLYSILFDVILFYKHNFEMLFFSIANIATCVKVSAIISANLVRHLLYNITLYCFLKIESITLHIAWYILSQV